MTFTEAAALVLRLVGKPLHYKEITDVAIERNLLSHVGKSPEVTMGARLNALIKKTDKDNPIVRVKPGVFALRDWDEKTIEDGLKDRTPALERVSEEALREAGFSEVRTTGFEPLATHAELDDGSTPPDEEEKHRAELSAGATELFEPEEDDDKPIFGAEEEEESAQAAEEGDAERRDGKRRRRRRRGRGRREEEAGETSDELDDDLPTYTMSDAGPDELSAEEDEPEREREPSRGRERERDRDRDRERNGGERREERNRDSDREGERGRDREREREGDWEGGLPEGGAELAHILERALQSYERSRGPVAAQNLADSLRRKWKGDASLNAAALIAVAQADNLRAELLGKLPRFRIVGSKLAPTSWSLDRRADEKQKNLLRAAEQLRESTLRSLADQLAQLPHRAVGELVLVLLDRLGARQVEVLRRPGAHGSEIHLSATFPFGGPEPIAAGTAPVKTAVVIRRDGRDVGRERVTELRGALHHYGPAGHGWILTTGQILSGAREEALSSGASPVSLTGRAELAELCLSYGVGVRPLRVEVPVVDLELFEGLSGR